MSSRCLIKSRSTESVGVMEVSEDLLRELLEVYERSRRPKRRVGYMRVRRVLGEVIGYKDKGEVEGGEGRG